MPDEAGAREEPLLTAAKQLAWRSGGLDRPLPRLPDAAVLTHQGSLMPRRSPWSRGRSRSGLSFETRLMADGAVVLAGVRGVGAPGTAIAIEELAATGVRRVVMLDIGGSIDEGAQPGAVVLVERALACDGTSRHYFDGREVYPDEGLTSALSARLRQDGIAFTTGAVWSTDAIYRELPSQIARARASGAILADMEAAATLAVARFLGLQASAVLVVADQLHGEWRPPPSMAAVRTQLQRLLALVTSSLAP